MFIHLVIYLPMFFFSCPACTNSKQPLTVSRSCVDTDSGKKKNDTVNTKPNLLNGSDNCQMANIRLSCTFNIKTKLQTSENP